MKTNGRNELEIQLDEICVGYLETPDYKSGSKKKEMTHKVCCEWKSYCAFHTQTWFYIVIIVAGFILINIISVIFLSCYFMRKNNNFRQSGGQDEEIE